MRIRTSSMLVMLTAAGSVLAGQSALEDAATGALQNKAQESVPKEAVQGVEAAHDAVEKAKMLKESAGKAPQALQEQALDAAKQKAGEAIPSGAKQGVETVKEGAKTASKAKAKLSDPSKAAGEAVDAAKEKALQKGTEKALDLLK